MTTYAYNPHTGELIQSLVIADWMGTTTVEPPAHDSATESCIWDGDAWEVRAATQTPIEDRRATRWEQVKVERTRRENGGVQLGGHWFQTDADSRIRFMRLDAKASSALAAGGTPSTVLTVGGQDLHWKTEENELVPMTAGLAQSIATAIENLDAAAFARGEALRAQVNASDSPESIDITTGWPLVFGDL